MSSKDKRDAFDAAIARWRDRINDNSMIIGQLEFLAKDQAKRPDYLVAQAISLRHENEALANSIVRTEKEMGALKDD